MDALQIQREALQELVARALGERPGSPRFLAQERRGALAQAEILGLPEEILPPLQNLSLVNGIASDFVFMLDYDGLR